MSTTTIGNIKVTDLEKIKQVIEDIRDGKEEVNWLTLGYGTGRNIVELSGQGAGGMEELFETLTDDVIAFCYLRVNLDALRKKIIFISFVGQSSKPMKRAFVCQHKADIESILTNPHLSLSASSDADLDADDIMKQLHKVSGVNYDGQRSQDKGILSVDPNWAKTRKEFFAKQELTDERDVTKSFNTGPLSTTPMNLSGRPGITASYINDEVPKTKAKPAIAVRGRKEEPKAEPVVEAPKEEPKMEEPAAAEEEEVAEVEEAAVEPTEEAEPEEAAPVEEEVAGVEAAIEEVTVNPTEEAEPEEEEAQEEVEQPAEEEAEVEETPTEEQPADE